MKILDQIAVGNKTPISIEIIPPRKDAKHINGLFKVIEEFTQYNLSFISVTSHAHERVIENINNRETERIKRKRWDTNALCIAIKERFKVNVAPHIICSGFNKDETEDALYNLHLLGVQNVIALKGDYIAPPTTVQQYQSLSNRYASDLVKQIKEMNQGLDIDGVIHELQTDFCIGVAAYPEKHYQADSLEQDIDHLKYKIDQGAHFIVTQMFFDNDLFYSFMDKIRAAGINVPVIAGIKPIYKKIHLEKLSKVFHISIPTSITDRVISAKDDDEVQKIGIEVCTEQCKNLVENSVQGLHFYTMSVAHPVVDVLRNI